MLKATIEEDAQRVAEIVEQIKYRRYEGKLKGYGDEILLVGINYDKDSKDKKHSCVIERVKF